MNRPALISYRGICARSIVSVASTIRTLTTRRHFCNEWIFGYSFTHCHLALRHAETRLYNTPRKSEDVRGLLNSAVYRSKKTHTRLVRKRKSPGGDIGALRVAGRGSPPPVTLTARIKLINVSTFRAGGGRGLKSGSDRYRLMGEVGGGIFRRGGSNRFVRDLRLAMDGAQMSRPSAFIPGQKTRPIGGYGRGGKRMGTIITNEVARES